MILIADSGATKSDWCLIDPSNGNVKYFATEGVNPQIQTQSWIVQMLMKSVPLTVQQMKLNKICFYGAGISSAKQTHLIETTLKAIFHCDVVEANHDLLGAVHALCGNDPGIACILGTGSNSVYFDGKKLIKKSVALGFILGDEGSGAYIGKRLIADYLQGKLPGPVAALIDDTEDAELDCVLQKVYKEPNPNRYLASLCSLLANFRGDEYVENLLRASFGEFFHRHVLIYPAARKYPIHFIGSIAHYYSDVLEALCKEHGLTKGKIIQRPIEALVAYHQTG